MNISVESAARLTDTHLSPYTYTSLVTLAPEPMGRLDPLVAQKSPGVGLGWPLQSAPGDLTEGDGEIEENPDHPGAVAYKHRVCLSFPFCQLFYLLQYPNS